MQALPILSNQSITSRSVNALPVAGVCTSKSKVLFNQSSRNRLRNHAISLCCTIEGVIIECQLEWPMQWHLFCLKYP